MTGNVLLDGAARAFGGRPVSGDEVEVSQGVLPFVTISCEAWALGRELGETILVEMTRRGLKSPFTGFKLYDRELCQKVAAETDRRVSMNSLLSEERRTMMQEFLNDVLVGGPTQYAIEHKVIATVAELAMAGRCILVGRGGACITRKLPFGVHVRLVAPKGLRIRRASEHYGIEAETARVRIEEQDRNKREFIRSHFRVEIDDPLLYDAVFNTGYLTLEEVAGLVITMLEERFRTGGR